MWVQMLVQLGSGTQNRRSIGGMWKTRPVISLRMKWRIRVRKKSIMESYERSRRMRITVGDTAAGCLTVVSCRPFIGV